MPKKAKWSAGKSKFDVAADGTAMGSTQLLDGGVLAGTVNFTITPDRGLQVLWVNEPGAAGLTGFTAWSQEG